jgi:membrane protease YdiL (CAAX protease family)
MDGTDPTPRPGFSAALLAVVETVGALAACLLVSLALGAALTLAMVSPKYDAELEIEPFGDHSATVSELIVAMNGLGLARQIESADDGSVRTLLFVGLATPDFPSRPVLEVLYGSGYRAGEHTVRPAYDTGELLRTIAAPYLTLQALVFLVAGWLLARLRVRRPSGPAGSGAPASLLFGLGAGLAAFTLSLLIGGLLQLLGIPVREQEWVAELFRDRAGLMRLLPWIIFIVPLSEEVFFRGYMFRLIGQRAGHGIAYAVSSILFAAVHFNPSGILIYFGIGMVLAWVYRRTGNLVAPVAGHFTHNSIVVCMALLAPPL